MAKKVTTTAAQPLSTPKSAEELFKDSLWLRAPGDSRAQREEFLEQPTVLAIRSAAPEVQREFFRLTLDRIGALPERLGYMPTFLSTEADYPDAAAAILRLIIPTLPLSDGDLAFGLAQLANLKRIVDWHHAYLRPLLDQLEAHIKEHGATPELKAAMERFLIALSAKDERAKSDKPDARQMAAVAKFQALIKAAKPAKASGQGPNGSPAVNLRRLAAEPLQAADPDVQTGRGAQIAKSEGHAGRRCSSEEDVRSTEPAPQGRPGRK